MGNMIITCPNCDAWSKLNLKCNTCNKDQPWRFGRSDQGKTGVFCDVCYQGYVSWNCNTCGQPIPVTKDTVAFYPDFQEAEEDVAEMAIAEMIVGREYNSAISLLSREWIRYILPTGFDVQKALNQAMEHRVNAMQWAAALGIMISSAIGALIFRFYPGFLGALWMMGTILMGMTLPAFYMLRWGGDWGDEKDKWKDKLFIVLASVVGAIFLPIAFGALIFWLVLWLIYTFFTDR